MTNGKLVLLPLGMTRTNLTNTQMTREKNVSEILGEQTSIDPVTQMKHSAPGGQLLWAARLQVA